MALITTPDNHASPRPQSRLTGTVVARASPSDRLIVALDFPSSAQALDLIERLEGVVSWFKIGLELYIAEGNSLVAEVERRGFSVFLDLKLHDIPNTVASAVRSAARLGVKMLTVHAAGGPDMLHAASEAAASFAGGPAILAVTVLTSMDAPQLKATGVGATAAEQVSHLAALAVANGVSGLVCSPNEVAALRNSLGMEPLLVTPGIRPEGSTVGDQRRVATPAAAMGAGASYLVVGRPITQAADSGAATRAILTEMAL